MRSPLWIPAFAGMTWSGVMPRCRRRMSRNEGDGSNLRRPSRLRHPGESRGPGRRWMRSPLWISAFAGMTWFGSMPRCCHRFLRIDGEGVNLPSPRTREPGEPLWRPILRRGGSLRDPWRLPHAAQRLVADWRAGRGDRGVRRRRDRSRLKSRPGGALAPRVDLARIRPQPGTRTNVLTAGPGRNGVGSPRTQAAWPSR